MPTARIGSGVSKNWTQGTGDAGDCLLIDVDTSSAKFSTTPAYVVSLNGDAYHRYTTGGSEPYRPTPTGFSLQVIYETGTTEKPGCPRLTPEMATKYNWQVAWVGVEA